MHNLQISKCADFANVETLEVLYELKQNERQQLLAIGIFAYLPICKFALCPKTPSYHLSIFFTRRSAGLCRNKLFVMPLVVVVIRF